MAKKGIMFWVTMVIGVLVLGGIGTMFVIDHLQKKGREEAYKACKERTKDFLKFPGSSTFQDLDDGVFYKEKKFVIQDQYYFEFYAYASNAFGAKLRLPIACSVEKVNNEWKIIHIRNKNDDKKDE